MVDVRLWGKMCEMVDVFEEIIQKSTILIHKSRYAYLKTTQRQLHNHFFVSQDKDEITIVTAEENLAFTKYEQAVKWFKLIEIKVSEPFVPGFIAKVTNIIAPTGANTLVICTFSKDYILTREEHVEKVVSALKHAGFLVSVEE